MSSETTANSIRVVPRYSNLRDLSVTYEGSSEDILIRPPDLSTRGMFINTTRRFPVGAVLTMRFTLARSGIAIRARGEVRYCLAGVGVGVEFMEISPQAVRAIQAEINPKAPARSRVTPRKS